MEVLRLENKAVNSDTVKGQTLEYKGCLYFILGSIEY